MSFIICLGSLPHALAQSHIIAWGDLDQSKVPDGLANVVQIASGHFHNLCLTTVGALSVWPDNFAGAPVPAGLTNVVRMATGVAHDLAQRGDSTVVAWGDNTYGQTAVPPGLSNVVAIGAGGYHCLAVRREGSVSAWGDNTYGQIAVPTTATNVVAVAAGFYHSLALRADGTVVAWGDDSFGQTDVPIILTNAVAIAAAGDHSLALTEGGLVVAWGDDSYGQSRVPADLTNTMAVAAGDYHSLALRRDGTVVAWGPRFYGATAVPDGLSNVVSVAAAGSHSLALQQGSTSFLTLPMTHRTVACGSGINLNVEIPEAGSLTFQWSLNGTNLAGATQAGLRLNNLLTNQTGTYSVVVSNGLGLVARAATQVTVVPSIIVSSPKTETNFAGATVNLSVAAESTVPLTYQWLLYGTNLPGATNATLTLPNLTWDQGGPYSVTLANAYGVVTSPQATLSVVNAVAWWGRPTYLSIAGNMTSIAVSSAGWGLAAKADGTVSSLPLPVRYFPAPPTPEGLNDVVNVGAGWSHGLVLRANRTVLAWGANSFGQTNVPAGLTNVVSIAAGDFHNLALRADGSVVAWGDNSSGQTGIPVGLTNVVAIATGPSASLALVSDGQIVAWGTVFGQAVTVPPGLTDVVAIAAGQRHFVALRSDGTALAWGDDFLDQTHVPSNLTDVVSIKAGGDESLAQRADGRVVVWGSGAAQQAKVLADLTNIVDMAAGEGTLVVLGAGPPRLNGPIVSRAVAIGANTSFRVDATGSQPLSYQWQFEGTNLPGATSPWLTLTNVQPQQAGRYSVTVSNVFGVTNGGDAALSVVPLLIDGLSCQPATRIANAGSSVSLSVAAQGLGLGYQWLFNGAAIPGATDSTLVLTNVQMVQAGAYSVIVSNLSSRVTSPNAPLAVLPLWIRHLYPSFIPTNYVGQDATFILDIVGSPPLSYQWQFNGVAIPGATNDTLRLTNLQLNQSGDYSAVVSNPFGVTNSGNARLTVQPFVFAWLPSSQTNFIGEDAYFNIIVEGPGPFGYQWRFNGTNIPGATSDMLALKSVTPGDSGSYSVAASNAYGVVTSPEANLVVVNVVEWQPDLPAIPPTYFSIPGVTSIAVSEAGWALAAKADGTVATIVGGLESGPAKPDGLKDVVTVASGWQHGLALRTNGTVLAWGDNGFGQTNTPPGLTNVVSIAAGDFHNLALRSDGSIAAWGDNASGQTDVPAGLSNVVAIAAGTNSSVGITRDGKVLAWGADNAGRPLKVPVDLTNVVAVAAANSFLLALRSDRTVAMWRPGSPEEGFAPPGLTNVVAIAGSGESDLELMADGRLTSWANPTNLPTNLYNVIAIASGGGNLALIGSRHPVLSAVSQSPRYDRDGFAVWLPTQNGRVYSLEYKDSLNDSEWTALPLVFGTGSLRTLADPTAKGTQRFYRVRQW